MVVITELPSKKFKRRIGIQLDKPASRVEIFEADLSEVSLNEIKSFIKEIEERYNCSCKFDVKPPRAEVVCGCG
jgi:hypothetical protein